MKDRLQQTIEALRHLRDERAQIAAAVIVVFAAIQDHDVEPKVIAF